MSTLLNNGRGILVGLLLTLLVAGCAGLPSGSGRIGPEDLLNAILEDQADYVAAAVKAGRASVDQRIPAPVYMEGAPLITLAARAGSVNVVRYLIDARADINALTPATETALMLAAFFRGQGENDMRQYSERHEKIVRMLVEAGATLENEPHNYTPLAYAAFQGHDRIIRYLLDKGASVDAGAGPATTYINTPLMMAAMQGHRNSTLMLLRAGANARVRVHHGLTAAELAAKYQGQSLVPLLRCAEGLQQGERFAARCEVARAER